MSVETAKVDNHHGQKRKTPEGGDDLDGIIENLTRVVFEQSSIQGSRLQSRPDTGGNFLRFAQDCVLDRVRAIRIVPYNAAKCDYVPSAGVTMMASQEYHDNVAKSFYASSSFRLTMMRPYGPSLSDKTVSTVDTSDFGDLVENHLKPLVSTLISEGYIYYWNRSPFESLGGSFFDSHHQVHCLEEIEMYRDFLLKNLCLRDRLKAPRFEPQPLSDASSRLSERVTMGQSKAQCKRRRCALLVNGPRDLWVTRKLSRCCQLFQANDEVKFIRLYGPTVAHVRAVICCHRQRKSSKLDIDAERAIPGSVEALELLKFRDRSIPIDPDKYDIDPKQILNETFSRFLDNGYAALYPRRHPLSPPVAKTQFKVLCAAKSDEWTLRFDDDDMDQK